MFTQGHTVERGYRAEAKEVGRSRGVGQGEVPRLRKPRIPASQRPLPDLPLPYVLALTRTGPRSGIEI